MKILDLNKVAADRVMGMDCSTNSMAFGIIEGGDLVKWGEIFFSGRDVYHRGRDAKRKVEAVFADLQIDFVSIEAAVMVRNVDVAIKMAYVSGAIMASLLTDDTEVYKVRPLEWQTAIGNPILKKPEKDAIMKANPGKSKTWYQAAFREFRKQRTIEFVRRTYGVTLESDNVADAIGVCYHAYNTLTRRA